MVACCRCVYTHEVVPFALLLVFVLLHQTVAVFNSPNMDVDFQLFNRFASVWVCVLGRSNALDFVTGELLRFFFDPHFSMDRFAL